jgi:23S rRNA (uracil1939-C5)-methyltransferase
MKATIEKMVYGGLGLARTGQGIIFIPDTIPGETVETEIEETKGGFATGKLVSILEQSPVRRIPACKFAGICGGCEWLHIDYKSQLIYKNEIFIDCLSRIGRIKEIPQKIEIFDSPETGYRRRAQIKLGEDGNCGFFKKKTNDIVNIDNCPLLSDSLNSLLKRLPQHSSALNIKNLKVISGDSCIASSPVIPQLTEKSTVIKSEKHSFTVDGGGFFQSNRFVIDKLGNFAAGITEGELFIDLYGGIGFFSVFLSSKFKKGFLVESIDSQVSQAQKNFADNGITNVCAIASTVEKCGADKRFRNAPLLLVDPPRPGLTRKACESIASLKPQKILYVSCNASTQARDTGFFVNQCGYGIKKAALFDLYPNTFHLETVLLFEKKTSNVF